MKLVCLLLMLMPSTAAKQGLPAACRDEHDILCSLPLPRSPLSGKFPAKEARGVEPSGTSISHAKPKNSPADSHQAELVEWLRAELKRERERRANAESSEQSLQERRAPAEHNEQLQRERLARLRASLSSQPMGNEEGNLTTTTMPVPATKPRPVKKRKSTTHRPVLVPAPAPATAPVPLGTSMPTQDCGLLRELSATELHQDACAHFDSDERCCPRPHTHFTHTDMCPAAPMPCHVSMHSPSTHCTHCSLQCVGTLLMLAYRCCVQHRVKTSLCFYNVSTQSCHAPGLRPCRRDFKGMCIGRGWSQENNPSLACGWLGGEAGASRRKMRSILQQCPPRIEASARANTSVTKLFGRSNKAVATIDPSLYVTWDTEPAIWKGTACDAAKAAKQWKVRMPSHSALLPNASGSAHQAVHNRTRHGIAHTVSPLH